MQPEIHPDILERNSRIWREYCRGASQRDLGLKYKLGQQHISAIIKQVRDTIPMEDRLTLIQREVAYFEQLRNEVMELWYMPAAPVTSGRDGKIVLDPVTKEPVRDHSGRLAAVHAAEKLSGRMHRLLGLDAAIRVDINGGEEESAKRAAAEAIAELHGG